MENIIQLGKHVVSSENKPYIIAEIGVNHEGSLERAKEMILQAKRSGANAAKFQTYKADKLASKDSPAYWDISAETTTSQYKLFKRYDSFGRKEYSELASFCESQSIDFISTPFDSDAVDFLNDLMPFYKIASADITNLPFLKKVASKSKPVVLSTGASTLFEIDFAVDYLHKAGCENIALLHCVLNYPTPNKNAHLGMIKSLVKCFPDKVIGYSDHTLPDKKMTTLVTAYLLGARIIEKHFTDDKKAKGNDHYHAMDENDLANFTSQMKNIMELVGNIDSKCPIQSEQVARQNARRSIVLKTSLPLGGIIKEADLTYKRPGTGISPLNWDQVIGMKVLRNLPEDHILQWRDLDPQC